MYIGVVWNKFDVEYCNGCIELIVIKFEILIKGVEMVLVVV